MHSEACSALLPCSTKFAFHFAAELGDDFERNENFYTVYECDERSGVWKSPALDTKYMLRCQKGADCTSRCSLWFVHPHSGW